MSRIVVKNLPSSGVSEAELRQHFNDIDNITDVKLKYNDYGAFRRFAFVGFKSHDAAERAIEKLNSSFIKTSKIAIESCKAIKDVKEASGVTANKLKRNNDNGDNEKGNEKNIELWKKPKLKPRDGEKVDPFEDVKNDPDFKEFLNLQRNIGENSQVKRIWSDDAKLDAENVAIPAESAAKPSAHKADDGNKKMPNSSDGQQIVKKKHKRSRGKKKSTKTKPKELFVYTLKAGGFPETTRRKDVKDFFKPLEALSIRLNKKDGVCYVSFKDESDLKFALRKDLHFWNTSRIKLWRHDVKRSRVFKETIKERVREKEEKIKRHEESLMQTEPIEESGRLFVRNLNYTCTQEDLEQVFAPYGQLTEVHFPIDKKTSLPKGYAYVEFMFPQEALRAYKELNGTIFQGRNFHLIPSKPKPEPTMVDGFRPAGSGMAMSSFKREQLAKQREAAPKGSGSNWNILFLGQNALANVVADSKGIEKSQLLTKHSNKEPIAVRMALGDANLVDETRNFLISNGIELDSFDNAQAPRSRTVLLVKNLPTSVAKGELVELFETHGRVSRVIMPPNGLTAIVEMEEPVEAKLAFKRLAYTKFRDSVVYLEWAPINVFREKSLEAQNQDEMKQLAACQTGSKILVKNVAFEATVGELKKLFAAYGELNFVRLPKKLDGQHRGFGFVDYLTREEALRAFRALGHSTHFYGRKLVLEWAKHDHPEASSAHPSGADQAPGCAAQELN